MTSRLFPARILVLVAYGVAVGTFSAVTASEAGGPAALEFRRIYTPEGQLEEMPRDHVRYLPMKAEQFEQLLAAGRNSGSDIPAGGVWISSARYTASLTSKDVLLGEATLEILHRGAGRAVLSLEPCGIAISNARWLMEPPEPATIGLGAEGKLEALVERSAKLHFQWSVRGSRDSSGVLWFPLDLPASPSNSLTLDLSAEVHPLVKPGIVVREPPQGDVSTAANAARWQIELGGHSRVELRLVPSQQADSGRQLMLSKQFLVYDVSLRGIELSAELRLDVHHEPIRQLTVGLDAGMELVAARYGDSAVRWSILSRPAGGTGNRVLLELPEPVQGAERIIKLRAVGPTVTGKRWRLPGLRTEGAFWQEGNATIAVRAPLSLKQLAPIGGRQAKTGTLSFPRPGETADIQYFSKDAGVEVLVAPVEVPVRLITGTAVELGNSGVTGEVVAELSVPDGEIFQLEAEIGRQWLIDSVRSHPPEALGDGWSIKRDSKRLVIPLDQALSPARPVRLIVSGRRLHSPLGRSLTVQDLTPLQFVGIADQRHLLTLRTVEPYRLKLDGAESLSRVNPDALRPGKQSLFLRPPGEFLFENDGNVKRLRVSLATPKPSYSATIGVEASVTERTLAESYQFRIVPNDAPIERLLIHFSCPRPESPKWNLASGTDDSYSARRLSGAEQAAAGLDTRGETWELAFGKAKVGPFEIGAARFSDMSGNQAISLAGLPLAAQQKGTLIVRSLVGRAVRVASAMLDPLPVPFEPFEKQNTAMAAYRYDPVNDAANSDEAAATVAVDSQSLPLAWIWNCVLRSRYYIDGSGQHSAIFRLENSGKADLTIRLPSQLAENPPLVVDADASRAAWRRESTTENDRIVVDLPPGRRFPTVRVHFATRPQSSGALQAVSPPTPVADIPVVSQNWTVWLPPGYQFADPRSPDLSGRSKPLTWSQRLFGPLARPAERHPFRFSDVGSWTEVLWRRHEEAEAGQTLIGGPSGPEPEQDGLRQADFPQPPQESPGPWVNLAAGDELADTVGWSVARLEIPPGRSVRLAVIRRDLHRITLWLALLLAVALSWWGAGKRPAVVVAIGFAAAAATCVLPDFYAPAGSGIVLGLLVGLGCALVRGGRRQTDPAGELTRIGFSTVHRTAGLRGSSVVMMIAAAGVAGAASAPDLTRAEEPPPQDVYNVLIPVDADEKPTGGTYYVPESLYQELRRRSDESDAAPQGWLLRSASYRGVLARQSGPEQFAMTELVASFDVEVHSPTTTVRIPLGRRRVNLLPNGATLDGEPVQPEWRDDEMLAVPIAEPGVYQLELALHPITQDLGSHRGIVVEIPRLATSRLEIDLPPNAPLVEVPSAKGAVVIQQTPPRVLAELGATDRLEVRWSETAASPGFGPGMDVEQLLWLKIHPGSVVLGAKLKIRAIEGSIRRLRVNTDPRLRLLPFREADGAVAQVHTTAGQPQKIQLELAKPIEDQATVELHFLLTGASGIGHVRLPLLELEGARVVKRWMAASVDPALDYEQQFSDTVEPVAPPEFEVAWGRAESQPMFAYSFDSAQPNWSLATRPDEPQIVVDQVLAVSLAPGTAQVQFDVRLVTTGYEFQYRVLAPRDLQVDKVSIREQAVERVARWSRDGDGAVVIFLNGPAAEDQELSLSGHMPVPMRGRCGLPQLRVDGTEMRSCEIQLFREPSVLVEVEKKKGLVDVELPIVGQDKAELGRLVSWFTVADCSEQATAELSIAPNQPEAVARQTIRLRSGPAGWEADVEHLIVVRRGVVDEFRLQVPPEWPGPYRVEPNVSLETRESLEDRGRELIIRPRLAVRGEYRLKITGPLAPKGQPIGVPRVRLLEARTEKTVCILPTLVGDEPVYWETRGLSPVEVSEGVVSVDRSESLVAFESQEESFQAILDLQSATERLPTVLLADTQIAWHDNGAYHGLAIFDIEPAGETDLPLKLPERAELVHLRVGGMPVAPEEADDGSWLVRPLSAVVPLRVEVLYFGRPARSTAQGPVRLERPGFAGLPVHETLWTVFGPEGFRLRTVEAADRADAAQLDRIRLKSTVSLLRQMKTSGILDSEEAGGWVAPWLAMWAACRERLQHGGAAADLQLLDEEFASIVKDTAASPPGAARLLADTAGLWSQVVSARNTSAYYVGSPGAASLTVVYEQVGSGGRWQQVLLGTAFLALIPVALAGRVRRTALELACRWPMAVGVILGVSWWLLLEPSAFGWVIIALTFVAATRSRYGRPRRPSAGF